MKRADIQGLRTVAILAVLLYHIWPSTFPSGFLGVDVFFVISGHLIAKCLANIGSDFRLRKLRDKIAHFYTRRIQRIVPVYLALACGTTSIAHTLMLDSDFHKARNDLFWALGFVSNLQAMFEGDDYFAEVFAYRPFLHTWSLGVEMQFYLLAPGLMLLLLGVRRNRFWRFLLTGLCLLLSVAGQQLATRWDRAVGFGLVFCRLWQFLAGILVFFLIDSEANADEKRRVGSGGVVWPFVLTQPAGIAADQCLSSSASSSKMALQSGQQSHQQQPTSLPCSLSSSSSLASTDSRKEQQRWHPIAQQLLSHSLLLGLCTVLLLPLALGPTLQPFQSTAVVLLTAGLIYAHRSPEEWTIPVLLTNRVAVWAGDLSYVWYLVHWPTILFIKYFFTIDSFAVKYWAGIGTLALTLVLAVVIDRLVDAHIRLLPNFCAVFFLIGLLYTFCFFLILPTYYSGQVERIATAKDYDGSLGERAVTVDVNFTRMVIDDIEKSPESRARLASTLSLYEKIRMNELIQSATFDDRYKLLPGEVRLDTWSSRMREMVPENRNFLKAIIERRVQSDGNATWMLVGNSHADVISRELQAEHRHSFSQFHVFTVPGCVPFFVPERLSFVTPDMALPFQACSSYSQLVKQAVERVRPDILFVAFRWYGAFQDVPFGGQQDELLGYFRNFLHGAQPHVRQRIFFPAPTLLFKFDTAKELAKRLWRGSPLDELHLSYKSHLELNRASYQRLELLDCAKCTVFDMATQFCNADTDKCLAYDEQMQLALFFDNNHLSYLGRQRVRPFLRGLLSAAAGGSN